MAASVELKHFTCSLCLKIFSEPKVLPCLHRFCESCLDKYINKSTQDEKNGFLCPCCKTFTKAPDKTRPRSAWAALFKTDFVIKEMINFKLREPSGLKHPCPTHTDTEIDYYCFDCSQILCHRCIVSSHRRCDRIMTLPEAANQKKASLEAAINKASSKLNGSLQLQDQFDEYHSRIDNDLRRVETDIKKWSVNVRKLVNDHEDQLLEQMNQKSVLLKKKVESEVEKVREVKNQVQGRIEVYLKLLSDGDMMLNTSVDDVHKSCHHEDLSQAVENTKIKCENICKVRFEFQELNIASTIKGNVLLVNYVNDIENANGDSKENISEHELKRSDMSDNVQVLTTITVRDINEINSFIRDMIVVGPDNTIIVTDYFDNSITAITNRGGTCTSLMLTTRPEGITQISQTLAAVSLPELRQIYVIEISPGLRVNRCIQCKESYCALATLTSSTLVAVRTSDRIDIIDLSGQVLKSITANSEEYSYPYTRICVSADKRILVCNQRGKSLVCISQEGEIQFTHTSLQKPAGVTCDSSGRILLLDENKLISLTSDGQFDKILFTFENEHLLSLAVDTEGLVYVVYYNKVKVLKIT